MRTSRPLHTVRPTTVVPAILPKNTHGSSLIHLGNTQVIAAITLSVGQPSPSLPSNGEIDVSATFSPLCGKRYNIHGRIVHSEDGSSSGNAVTSAAINVSDPQAIKSFVKRIVLSSGMIDPEDLCIEEGKSAWKLNISCVVVNHDGNVVDAILIACAAALQDVILPETKVISKGDYDVKVHTIISELEETERILEQVRKGRKLNMTMLPVPLTIGIFDGKLLVDPTMTEEMVCEGMITVVVDALTIGSKNHNESNAVVLCMQKTGSGISVENLTLCVQLCFGRAREMKQILSFDAPNVVNVTNNAY